MIKNFEPRLYQQTIFAACTEKNTLVVLPTGMGKTHVFVMLASHRLTQYPNSKILLLGPTRPLIEQYYNVFLKNFEIPKEKMAIFTGKVAPEKRHKQWEESQIIFSTPQGLENDVLSGKIKLDNVSLLGFDEAHRATGDYSYAFIAKTYIKQANFPRIIGLTASPGSDVERIAEVMKNLFIEGVEIRSDSDHDVKPYIKDIDMKILRVDLPESFKQIKKHFEDFSKARLKILKEQGVIKSSSIYALTKKELIGLQAQIHSDISHGNKDYELMKAISTLAEIMKVQHALELLETQDLFTLLNYMERLVTESYTTKVKAVRNLVEDLDFKAALSKTKTMVELKIEHPKFVELRKIIKEEISKDNGMKIIIFNQYRDQIKRIVEEINQIKDVKAEIFVGQQKKGGTGVSQKDQIRILKEFQEGKFNVVGMSSVGEEGLDIPEVDLVIFYEPIPSAIRQIQRRGRTGRQKEGRVIVLVAKGTRDEAYLWVAKHKEERMKSILYSLKKKFSGNTLIKSNESIVGQPKLSSYINEPEVRIFADYREKASGVIKELAELGVKIELESLKVGDYVLSPRVVVEFKTVSDFVDSIIDGRLLEQLKAMKDNFFRPIILIEGSEDLYSQRKIHANAIRGMIASIIVGYGVPIIQTQNYRETAALLYIIARREQQELGSDYSLHGDKKPLTLKQSAEYIVSSLPGVEATIAKNLLKRFGSIKNLVNASTEELKQADLVGEIKAKRLKELFEFDYNEE